MLIILLERVHIIEHAGSCRNCCNRACHLIITTLTTLFHGSATLLLLWYYTTTPYSPLTNCKERISQSFSSGFVFFIFTSRRTMQVLARKLVSFTMCIGLIILVLPFVCSSQEQEKSLGSHTNNNGNIHKVLDSCPQLSCLRLMEFNTLF